MQRLIKSSKFWALVVGGVMLVLYSVLGEAANDVVDQVLAVYLVVAPVVYNLMTGLEDALANKEVDLGDLITLIQELLTEQE